MAIREPEITIIASAEPQLVLNIIDNKPSIVFIPQLKTYLCNRMVSEGLAFDICEKEFEEYWNVAGPIALQFFCQELKEFMTDWPEHRRQQFDKLFVNRRFKKLELETLLVELQSPPGISLPPDFSERIWHIPLKKRPPKIVFGGFL